MRRASRFAAFSNHQLSKAILDATGVNRDSNTEDLPFVELRTSWGIFRKSVSSPVIAFDDVGRGTVFETQRS